MSKKWERIDPTDIKVGDEVKAVGTDFTMSGRVAAKLESTVTLELSSSDWLELHSIPVRRATWYRRKPAKVKPERPAEPEHVGVFFRVDRTGKNYIKWSKGGCWYEFPNSLMQWQGWEQITEPGDTITELELTPKPQTVMTKDEYAALPEGSIVASPTNLPWVNEGHVWVHRHTDSSLSKMAGTTRKVLRYGWGD